MSSQGKTINQIAKALGVDRATIYRWKNKYDDFSDILKEGEDEALDKVEESVYRRAVGFKVTEQRQTFNVDKDGHPRVAKVEKVTRHVVPDVGAAAFILKTRRSAKWKQPPETAVISDANNQERIDWKMLSPKLRMALMKELTGKEVEPEEE